MENTRSQEDVSQMFNSISRKYDRVNRVLSFGIDHFWRKMINRHIPKGSDVALLDCATGTCDQLIAIAKKHSLQRIAGVDLAEDMLALGREKLKRLGLIDRVELKCASACELPYQNGTFDCITMSFGIRNVQGNCLPEFLRVLKPGGRCLILEFSLPKNLLIRKLHLFYLRHILPFLGGLLSGNREAYSYLNKTIEAFPSGNRFLELLRENGFTNCKAIPLTFGVANLYIGHKE